MAENNALTFYVKFMEDKNNDIDALITQLSQKLQKMVVKLDSNNFDLSGLQAEMNKLKGFSIVDKDSLADAEKAIRAIESLLKTAFSEKGGEGQFGDLLQSLKAVREEIGKVAVSMGNLQTAISSLGKDLSASATKTLVDNMKTVTDATNKAAQAVENFNSVKGDTSKGGTAVNDPKNVASAAKEYEGLSRQIQLIDQELEKSRRFNIDTSDIERTREKMLEVQEMFKNIADPKYKGEKKLTSDVVVGENVRGLQLKARSELMSLREEIRTEFNKQVADNFLNGVRSKLKELGDISKEAGHSGLIGLGQQAKEAENALTAVYRKLQEIRDNGGSSKELSIMKNSPEMTAALKQYEEVKKAMAQAQKDAEKSVVRSNKSQTDAEIQRLRAILKELKRLQSEGLSKSLNKDAFKSSGGYKELEKAIAQIQGYIDKLKEAKRTGEQIGNIDLGDFRTDRAAATMTSLSHSQRDALNSTNELARAQQRMAQEMQVAIDKASQQGQVLNGLKSIAAQYLSVWGASNFVKEVAQITGELELQQKSLEVIIGSATKAQELFNDIKGMSQMSPYTFQDLLKTTRQLSAFGIETKDLYGTMKMLSDIGAGLDVDVQRLVLAYGHIKSAGVLNGIQRRQLETAGIGITGELAKLYNDRYRMAGSTERVTPEDVFKLIKDREVPFEDVEQVFSRLTSPGGKFYEMQLRQYDTLGGKLRNLKNNYNIMLDEIGKSYMSLLSTGVDTLNSLMEHWRQWKVIIESVLAAMAAVKVSQMFVSKSFVAHRAASLANLRTFYENQAVQAANGMPVAPRQGLGLGYVNTVNESNLTRFQKIRAALYSNVAKDARYILLTQQGLTPVYANHVNQMTKMQLRMERLKWGASAFGTNLGMALKTLVSNPYTWIFAAIAAVTALISKLKEMGRVEAQTRKSIRESEQEDIKNLDSTLNPIKESPTSSYIKNGRGEIEFTAHISSEEAREMVASLDQDLQKFDPLYKGRMFDIERMTDETEKAKALIRELESTRSAKEQVESQAGQLAAAIDSSGGVGKDSLTEELKEQEELVADTINNIKASFEDLEETTKRLATDEKGKELFPNIEEFYNDYLKIKAELGDAVKFEDVLVQYVRKGKDPFHFDIGTQTGTSAITEFFDKLGSPIGNKLFRHLWDKEGIIPDIDMYEIESNYKAIEEKTKKLNKTLKDGLRELYTKGDVTGEDRAKYLVEQVEKILSTEGNEITDPEIKRQFQTTLYENILRNLQDAAQEGTADLNSNVMPKITDMIAKEEAANFAEATRRQGQFNMDNLSPEDIDKLQNQFLAQVAARWDLSGEIGALLMRDFKNAFSLAVNGADLETEDLKVWQKKIKDFFSFRRFNDVKTRLKVKVGADADLEEFIKATQETYSEAKKKAEALARSLNIGAKLGVKITPEVMFGSLEQLKALRKRIQDKMQEARGSWFDPDFLKRSKEMQEVFGPILDYLNTMIDIGDLSKATGIDYAGYNNPDKNAEKDAREKEKRERERERAAEEARRKERKHYDDIIMAISRLRQEYKRLRGDGFNEEGAMIETKNYYDRMFKGKGIIDWSALKPSDITGVGLYMENINKLIDASSKLTKEDKAELKLKALEQLMQAENMDLKERSDKLLAEFNTRLEELSDSFSTLRKILDTTGRGDIAAAVSGLGEQGVKGGRLSGQIERVLNQRIATWFGEKNLDMSKLEDIDYESVGKMSGGDIEKYVEGLFGNKDTVDLVKPLIEGLKAYRKAIRDEEKESVDATAKTIAAAKNYNTQLTILDSQTEELNKKIRETKGLLPEQVETLIAQNNADRDLKAIQLEPGYARFMRGDTGQYLDDVNGMTKRLTDAYQTLFNVGRISAEELMQRLADIRKSREIYFTGKREELLDISTKGRLEKELKTLLQDFFKIAERAELAKNRRDKAMDAKEKALSKFNDLNNTYNENVEKGKRAREYERLAMQASNPQTRAEYERQAQELRDEIAKNEVKPSDIIKAQQAVDDAEMQIKMADITIQSTKKSLEDKNKEIENKENEAQGERNARTTITKIVEHLKKFSEALDFVHSVLDSFGVDASALEDTISVIGGATQGAEVGMSVGNMLGGLSSALGNAGPWGAAAGAALGIAGQLAQIHDKNLQRRIDEIKLDTTKMSNTLDSIKSLRERQFGYDTGELRKILGLQYTGGGNANIGFAIRGTDSASLAMREYYTRYASGSGYEQELKLLEEQRQKLMEMYDLEASKKKKSKEDLEDYKKQIADLDEQIHFFVEDLAKELWGIDLKGWADQLGDALMTAFENGTSAASAFHDTVQDIMRNMVKSMLVTSVIEPAMENLSEKLFGKDGKGGVFGDNGGLQNAEKATGAVLAELGNWFNTEGPALMDAANEFYNGADNMMRQTLGYGMRENERSSNTVNSIQSAASEETMGIVAGYLSRLSQDVSVQRIMQEMFVNGSWPNYIEQVTSVNDSVAAIDRSTTAMMEMMRDGTGALYERVENMSRRLDNFANGVDRIYIN